MQQRTPNKRRTFSVRDQLVGKLGPRGYGALLTQLDAVAVADVAAKPKRRRRRSTSAKVAA